MGGHPGGGRGEGAGGGRGNQYNHRDDGTTIQIVHATLAFII